jgi:hypothetical protein
MDANDLRVWCMQHPRPALVRVTNNDGQQQEVIVQGAWTKLADTLFALQPELLEALNAEKQLLRALNPNDLEDGEDWQEAPEQRAARSRPAASTSDIPLLKADPETQRFALMGQLLADAYKDANTARDAAFQHLISIVDTMTRRADGIERARDALHKMQIKALQDQLAELGQEPEKKEDELTLQTILGAVAAGLGQAGSTTNGKA